MKIIGVTGQPSSGKDAVADYLAGEGFVNISGGDILREQMRQLGIPTDRTHLTEFSSQMRAKHGNDYLARQSTDRVKGDTVISGIRNTDEVALFRAKFGDDFIMIAVDAPIKTRYRWARERGRMGDEVTFERFKAEEERERASVSGSHQVDAVIALADVVLVNDGTIEDLHRKVDEFLTRLDI